MIDQPVKKSTSAREARVPQMDHAMRRAVDQLHDIAQAAASQKEHDAKMLAAAMSSAQALRDIWQQKAKSWQRAVWVCAACGMIASGAIGFVAWHKVGEATLQQQRLRHELVKQNDEINSLHLRASVRTKEASQIIANSPSITNIETMISRNTQDTNRRFEALASNAEALVQRVSNLSHKQNGLLLTITQMLHKLDDKLDTPVRILPPPLNIKTESNREKTPATVTETRQVEAEAPSPIRFLRSRPIEDGRFTDFEHKTASQPWHLPQGFQNPSGICIPNKPPSK